MGIHRTSPRRLVVAAALALSGLLLAACGSQTGTTAAPGATDPTTASEAPSATAARVGPTAAAGPTPQTAPALQFRGTTLDGAAFSGAALAGKPAVLWFWAPWCTICRGEAPDIARLSAQYAGRVQFVGIAGLGSVDEMKGFVSDTGTGDFTHLSDLDGSLWARFGVPAQPSFVFVTRTGDAQRVIGGISADDLSHVLDQLVAA